MVDQREELPLLPFGNPIGKVPVARRGIIINLYFVSFVLFVVIFSICEKLFISLFALSRNGLEQKNVIG
jgi:hypothetical protein